MSQEEYHLFLASARFWLEGVAVVAIGAFGLFGNVLTVAVLKNTTEANKNFNKLLMALAIVDVLLIAHEVGDTAVLHNFLTYKPHWYKVRRQEAFSITIKAEKENFSRGNFFCKPRVDRTKVVFQIPLIEFTKVHELPKGPE